MKRRLSMSNVRSDAFKKRIVYQIYPMSFCDSNNDGYGDINGIISKLDYLKDLGVGIIWLSPIYKSPLKDNGYDISDYYDINPIFGTMEDFNNLIQEAEKRDIKIVMDLVINHTSNEHEWFKEAIANPDSKYRDYYYFAKGTKTKAPNNWNSAFTGSCWTKVPNEDDTYYLHLYTKDQIDLNYHSEELIKEIEKILKFYLDKGVYGFRCDVINQIYKTSLENGKFSILNRGKEHYVNQEGCHMVLRRFYDDVLSKYDTFLVGETGMVTPEIANRYISNNELDTMFEFDHANCDTSSLIPILPKKFKMTNLLTPIFDWQEKVKWVSVYLENHDQRRSVSRYGNDKKYHDESAKALAILLLTLRGTTYIYQGEEIGMTDYHNYSIEDVDDCATKYALETAKKILFFLPKKYLFKLLHKTHNRDNARSPMQWDSSINAGFNSGHKTWLKVNENYNEINVKKQIDDPNSILNFYKKLIEFKTNSPILLYGDFKLIESNNKYAIFERVYHGESLLILLNLNPKKVKCKALSNLYLDKVLFNSTKGLDTKYLLPYQAIIYRKD